MHNLFGNLDLVASWLEIQVKSPSSYVIKLSKEQIRQLFSWFLFWLNVTLGVLCDFFKGLLTGSWEKFH